MAARKSEELLVGEVVRVPFHNPDTGFCILKVKPRGKKTSTSVLGIAPAINPGEWISATGRWESHKTYGRQFRAEFLRTSPPSSVEAIESYLKSGLIHGIGEVFAGHLVARFGEDTLDVIENQPERLQEAEGIGPVRAKRIIEAWADSKSIREIMFFLHEYGIGASRASRIYKTYGNAAVKVISENPYRLILDIHGIGFKVADTIAMKGDISPADPMRIRAGIEFVLRGAVEKGSCGLPVEELHRQAATLLDLTMEKVGEIAQADAARGSIIVHEADGTPCYFDQRAFRSETEIAKRLSELTKGRLPWREIDSAKAVDWVEHQDGMTFSDSQRRAIARAVTSKVLVITGGPGVGKTTVVKAILKIVQARKAKPLLCAPTGRAAKRLGETTGREARTIHRLLSFDPQTGGFLHDEDNPLDCDYLVVDEASMVDVHLMASLLKSLPRSSGLLIVGDADQLPSVGPGRVLQDIIGSGAIPVAAMTEVYRQAEESQIVLGAHKINSGEVPSFPQQGDLGEYYFIPVRKPEDAPGLIVKLIAERIPRRFGFDAVDDIQLLCPMNAGASGTKSMNLALQQVLNPRAASAVEKFGWKFAIGDKVMQTVNNYDKDVFNGDIGRIRGLDREAEQLVIQFDERTVTYAFDDLDAIVPAYAITVHKSQGSEYPAIVMPVLMQHFIQLKRKLLYTGVTRAKRLVVLVGQEKALSVAVRTSAEDSRWSLLEDWLKQVRAERESPRTGPIAAE